MSSNCLFTDHYTSSKAASLDLSSCSILVGDVSNAFICSSALRASSFRQDVALIRHRKILTRTFPSGSCEQYDFGNGNYFIVG